MSKDKGPEEAKKALLGVDKGPKPLEIAEGTDITRWPTREELAIRLGMSLPGIIYMERRGHLTPYAARDGITPGRPKVRYNPEEIAVLERYRGAKKGEGEDPINEAEELGTASSSDSARVRIDMQQSSIMTAVNKSMQAAHSHTHMLMDKIQALMTAMTDVVSKTMGSMQEENTRLRARASELEGKSWEMWQLIREAHDTRHAREIEELDSANARRMKEQAFEQVMKYLPVVATLISGKVAPGNPVVKEAALTDVVDRMSPEQLSALAQSGVLDQVAVNTILTVKERLIAEKEELIRRQQAAIEEDTAMLETKRDGS